MKQKNIEREIFKEFESGKKDVSSVLFLKATDVFVGAAILKESQYHHGKGDFQRLLNFIGNNYST